MGFLAAAAPAIIGVGASIIGGNQARSASRDAANTQARSDQAGIDEQRRQFDAVQELLKPYVQAGTGAMGQQQALLGLSGAQAQQQAIAGLQNSPQMQALLQQGENAMLQNASATGGLRGGNIQAALAQFRPQMLAAMIDQQYGRLGGLAGIGQASAAGQAAMGQNMAGNIGNLLGQQGAAIAGGQLARGAANQQLIGGLAGAAGSLVGSGTLNNLFGGAGANPYPAGMTSSLPSNIAAYGGSR